MTKTTKTILWLVVTIIAISLIWWGVSQINDQEKKEGTVTIGMVSPLTGDAAFWGQSSILGAELAKRDLAKDGIELELIIEDGQLDAKLALAAAQKLVNIDQVGAIYSEFTPAAISINSFVKDKDIFHLYNSAPVSPLAESPNTYKTYVDYQKNCQYMAEFIKDRGVKKVGLLKMGLEFAELCASGVREVFSNDLLIESYNPGDIDFRTALLKLKDGEVQAIFNPAFPVEVTNSFRQIIELGMDVYFITPTDALTADFISEYSGLLDKVYIYGLPEATEIFVKRLSDEIPNGNNVANKEAAVMAYIHIKQMAVALANCGSGNMACIREQMDSVESESYIRFNGFNNRIADFDRTIKEWDGSQFTKI